MKTCDLHCHSSFSDGSLTPTELVGLAEAAGLSALALTDHNTSQGLDEFMRAGEGSSVITVPGCEFSTDYEGRELHIVGLFFPRETWPEIEDYVEFMRISKRNSNNRLIASLRGAGYDITGEEVAALTDSEEFNRAHVARVLLQKGYVRSMKVAFQTLLREGAGHYVPPKRVTALGTIRFIKLYGAMAVLAHPFLNLDQQELETFLPLAKEAGLDAIETHYTEFDGETVRRAEATAARFGLKQSGGSDFHGAAKPDIRLGTGRGNLEVPFEFYEALNPAKR